MKKIITFLFLISISLVSQAGCDWSGYWLKKVNQQQNVYTFQTNVDWDNCVDYWWIVYDHQLKRYDTLDDFRGFTQVQFNAKGKYTLNLKVVDDCKKCDTTFTYLVDITIYGKAELKKDPSPKNCRMYEFEMTEFDTCVGYYYSIYKAEYFDTMTESRWRSITPFEIYSFYDFNEKDLVYYNEESLRKLRHEFKDTGRYLMMAYWSNRCTSIDTWSMNKVEVCMIPESLSVAKIKKEDPKLIGIYDMMGRRVYAIRENEILIYIYDDGLRKKIIQK